MRDVWKARLSIGLMALSLFLMIELDRIDCLGDSILEYFHIRSWSGGNHLGFHMTILYFGVVFLFSMLLVRVYAIGEMKFKKHTILLSVILLIVGFSVSTQFFVDVIKSNSKGLLAIGYHTDSNVLQYGYQDGDLTDLVAVFTLENYSNEEKTFYVSMDSRWNQEEGVPKIDLLDKNDNQARFELYPKEKRTFVVSINDYGIRGGNYTMNGRFQEGDVEIILFNKDEKVVLSKYNFLGVKIQ